MGDASVIDRTILTMPLHFHAEASLSPRSHFDLSVKQLCDKRQTAGDSSMRVCKTVLLGDVAVGKTSLVQRFCKNTFDKDYKATIGVDFEVEKFSVMSVPVSLQLWDTAGQERFRCIAASYYRSAHVIIVAFDMSDINSLGNAAKWRNEAGAHAPDALVFLVGTKKDLISHATYQQVVQQALHVANSIEAEFWAVSSLTAENVPQFFTRVVALAFEKIINAEANVSQERKTIGSNLINITDSNDSNIYEKRTPTKCC